VPCLSWEVNGWIQGRLYISVQTAAWCMLLEPGHFSLQQAIMEPLDHKNLDKDVPYFAEVVRWVEVWGAAGSGCSLRGSDLSWGSAVSAIADGSESAAVSLSAPQRTLQCSSGKTSRGSCLRECFIKSKCMKRTRTLWSIKEKKQFLRGEMSRSSAGQKLTPAHVSDTVSPACCVLKQSLGYALQKNQPR